MKFHSLHNQRIPRLFSDSSPIFFYPMFSGAIPGFFKIFIPRPVIPSLYLLKYMVSWPLDQSLDLVKNPSHGTPDLPIVSCCIVSYEADISCWNRSIQYVFLMEDNQPRLTRKASTSSSATQIHVFPLYTILQVFSSKELFNGSKRTKGEHLKNS